jgi:hypothetical protein
MAAVALCMAHDSHRPMMSLLKAAEQLLVLVCATT